MGCQRGRGEREREREREKERNGGRRKKDGKSESLFPLCFLIKTDACFIIVIHDEANRGKPNLASSST
jgi:hypothetical protein